MHLIFLQSESKSIIILTNDRLQLIKKLQGDEILNFQNFQNSIQLQECSITTSSLIRRRPTFPLSHRLPK